MNCLTCDRPLPLASKTQRYCPYCGATRILADPPSAGAESACLTIGYDVIGPQTGHVYGYRRSNEVPVQLHPLEGPFQADQGPWRDLYGAADSPLPENAWHVYRVPPHMTTQQRGEMSHSQLTQAAVRHTRIFALAESGQLAAIDARTLDYAARWQFPQWPAKGLTSRLRVSETLVYATFRTSGKTLLKAVDIGQGRPALAVEHVLAHTRPQILIAGGDVLVVGDNHQQQQHIERYRLQDYSGNQIPQPRQQFQVRFQSEPPTATSPARLGGDFVFAAADGKLYRWAAEGDEDPQVLWPNPISARLLPEGIALGASDIGFVADASFRGRALELWHVRQGAAGTAEMAGTVDLSLLRHSKSQCLAAVKGILYALVHGPDDPLRVFEIVLSRPELPPREILTLAGTRDVTAAELQVVPWKGEPHLLVQNETGEQRDFWLIHPQTGVSELLDRHPARAHQVRVLWEAERMWLVNLTLGRITSLA
jgi:hypothetical protein